MCDRRAPCLFEYGRPHRRSHFSTHVRSGQWTIVLVSTPGRKRHYPVLCLVLNLSLVYNSSMSNSGDKSRNEEGKEIASEVKKVAREYSSQADYVAQVSAQADARSNEVTQAIRTAFANVIRLEQTEIIYFDSMSVMDLARALELYSIIDAPRLPSRIEFSKRPQDICKALGFAVYRR